MTVDEMVFKGEKKFRVRDNVSNETLEAMQMVTGDPPGGLRGKRFVLPRRGCFYVVSFDAEGNKSIQRFMPKKSRNNSGESKTRSGTCLEKFIENETASDTLFDGTIKETK